MGCGEWRGCEWDVIVGCHNGVWRVESGEGVESGVWRVESGVWRGCDHGWGVIK